MEREQHTSRGLEDQWGAGGDIKASLITTISESAARSSTPPTAGVYAIDSTPSHLLPQVVSMQGRPQE